MNKRAEYADLAMARKACHRCTGLTNPADVCGGIFDSRHIGPWSCWQGNLDARLMVVGQDWGDTAHFVRHKGQEGPRNPTNLALVELVGLAGVPIGDPSTTEGRDVAFFTNAILCLKDAGGGLQSFRGREFDRTAACAARFEERLADVGFHVLRRVEERGDDA